MRHRSANCTSTFEWPVPVLAHVGWINHLTNYHLSRPMRRFLFRLKRKRKKRLNKIQISSASTFASLTWSLVRYTAPRWLVRKTTPVARVTEPIQHMQGFESRVWLWSFPFHHESVSYFTHRAILSSESVGLLNPWNPTGRSLVQIHGSMPRGVFWHLRSRWIQSCRFVAAE